MIGTATLGLSAGDVFCGARALSHGFRNAGCDVTTSVLAEHDAEWVTDGVGEDSKARLTLTVHARGAECEQLLLGLVGIADANVEVQLLRMGRVWPARRDPFVDLLESQLPQAGLSADDHPAVDVLVDLHAQHLAVELREATRVGAVDHSLLEASDHAKSMSPRGRAVAGARARADLPGAACQCIRRCPRARRWQVAVLWSSPIA
jgi:hypothetical protein